MVHVAITYSAEVGGASVISLKKVFQNMGCEVKDADYREMMRVGSKQEFDDIYNNPSARKELFSHAKFLAQKFFMDHDIDCLVLSGSVAMIDPNLFGQERIFGENYDFSRTIVELALTHVAMQKGMPILGICGGHQVIATYAGGTIKALNVKEFKKQKYLNYEEVEIDNSLLKKIIEPSGDSKKLKEKFFGAHSQIVDKLGRGFEKVAIDPLTGYIEAAESQYGAPVLTTQFHPEVSIEGIPHFASVYKNKQSEMPSLRIFEYIRKAAETYKMKKKLIKEINSKETLKDELNERTRKSVFENVNFAFKNPFAGFLKEAIYNFFQKIKSFFLNIISNKLHKIEIARLERNNQTLYRMHANLPESLPEHNRSEAVNSVDPPHEILTETPACPLHSGSFYREGL